MRCKNTSALVWLITLIIGGCLFANSAFAHSYKSGGIMVGHPWADVTAPAAKNAEAYLSFLNKSEKEDALLGITSDVAEEIVIIAAEGNILEEIILPPNKGVALSKTGTHLLFKNIKAPWLKDMMVPMTLTFRHAAAVKIDIMVGVAGH
jgi:periplasmic copper chaperone A